MIIQQQKMFSYSFLNKLYCVSMCFHSFHFRIQKPRKEGSNGCEEDKVSIAQGQGDFQMRDLEGKDRQNTRIPS